MTAPVSSVDNAPRATVRAWLGLAVLALPTLLVSMDLFVMLLAVPRLSTALGASSIEQLWILDVYGFMVAGFLLTMGTLGDRIGRRKLLLLGATAFGLASILAAFSTGPLMLITARALLGIAGATLTPSTLSLIVNLFPNARQRVRAISIWAGCFVVGAIIGPVVGGIMLEHFWWGSVFLLAVPAMLLLLIIGPALLPEYRAPRPTNLDPASVALSLATVLPVIYGLKDLARHGPQVRPMATIAVGLALGVVFLSRQRRLANPLLDLRLFVNRGFTTVLLAMLAYTMLSGGIMVFVAQQFQLVAGLSPLHAGLAMAPGMVAAIASFQAAPILARTIRPAVLFSGGLVVSAFGLLLLTLTAADSGLALPIAAFVLASIGGGPLVALGTDLVISSVPPDKAGSAAGVAQTSNEFGYALGVAILGSIGTAVYRTDMADAGAPPAAGDTLSAAVAAAQGLPRNLADDLLTAAREAFVNGLHTVAIIASIALIGVAVLTATRLHHLSPLAMNPPTAHKPE